MQWLLLITTKQMQPQRATAPIRPQHKPTSVHRQGRAHSHPTSPWSPVLHVAATLTGFHRLCLPQQLLRRKIAGWCVGAASVNMAGNVAQSLFMVLSVRLSRNAGTTCLANEQMDQAIIKWSFRPTFAMVCNILNLPRHTISTLIQSYIYIQRMLYY